MSNELSVIQHAMRLQQEIIRSVLGGNETGRLHAIVHYIAALGHASTAYLVLFQDQTPISIDLDTQDLTVSLTMPDRFDISKITSKASVHTSPGTTVLGNLPYSNSIQLPICFEGIPIGMLEMINIKIPITKEMFRHIAAVHSYMVPSYCLLHEQMVNQQSQRLLAGKLDKTKQMYEAVMNNTHDIIASLNIRAEIQQINSSGRHLLGIADGTNLPQLNFESPTWEFLLEHFESGKEFRDYEVVLATPDDGKLFCLGSFTVEWGIRNDIVLIHVILKDISERIAAQRELWQSNIELTAANNQLQRSQQQMIQQEKLASIGQLAAGIAHEINNPLGFVRSNHDTMKHYARRLFSYIDLIEEQAKVGTSQRSEAKIERVLQDFPVLLQDSDAGFDRIIKIVKSLKDFSRIDSQGVMAPADLNKAILDTLTVARNSWRDIATIDTDLGELPLVECYLDELNQVFLNLVVNAAQAIAGLKLSQAGSIAIKTWRDGDRVLIQFDDSGPGIPLAIRNRIFEPFFTTKPIGQGTGLGLSMAYDTMTIKHHGKIRVDESILGGASFVLELPLLQEKGASLVENDLE